MTKIFDSVLVVNRGEIARRILKTVRRLGIRGIAVCSEADVEAPFVKDADAHVVLGPMAPKESYLNAARVLEAAAETGAEAIHPGYGFLAENADFADAVVAKGLRFVGPPAEVMRKMGSKLGARKVAEAAGIPIVPGSPELSTLEEAKAAAESIGYPVLVKASAGGGGIGMALAKKEKQLERAYEDARKKGATFFADDAVYLEKFIEQPAHVEVQIFGDHTGRVVALGERDCTVQRRNQKVLEETPSPRLDNKTRAEMLSAAVTLGQAVGYRNAGTVEMVYAQGGPDRGSFYFLEVNARLQVEHPVTEMVTGLDLVELQLRVAAGERLPETLPEPRGYAVEARICAEDPEKHFFPCPGTLKTVSFPEDRPGVRVDSGVVSGGTVSPAYDSLLAKVIAYGDSREEAMARLVEALVDSRIEGIKTNITVFERIADHEDFVAGIHDTSFLKSALGYKY